MLWEDKDLKMECVQSQDRTVIYWLATRTGKKEKERRRRRKEEEEEELFFLKEAS
jgi:hypothetical protein